MRYVFQNFFTLVKNEKFIFSVMLVCVFISAWTMLFSYGLYQNYSTLLVESNSDSRDISIGIAEGTHDLKIAEQCSRIVEISDGKIVL